MGSEGKYETRTMRLGLQMAMGQALPATEPPGPGKHGEEDASSINHRLIGLVNRLLWASLVRNTAEIERVANRLDTLMAYQLMFGFQALPSGGMPEQSGTGHDKQHLQYAAELAYVAWRFGYPLLLDLAVAWLRCKLTLDALFTAPSPSPRGKLPAILEPGFRADRAPGGGFQGKRDDVREEWHRVARLGRPVPASVLRDPLSNVDLASLWFYSQLPAEIKGLLAKPLGPPPLLFPIRVQRQGPEFIASLAFDPQKMSEVQIYAGWVDGHEVYGFNADPIPELSGAEVETVAGQPVPPPHVETSQVKGEPVMPPAVPPAAPPTVPPVSSAPYKSLGHAAVGSGRGQTRVRLQPDGRLKTGLLAPDVVVRPENDPRYLETLAARVGIADPQNWKGDTGEALVVDWIEDIVELIGLPARYRLTRQDTKDLLYLPGFYAYLRSKYREATGKEPGVGDSRPTQPPKPEPAPPGLPAPPVTPPPSAPPATPPATPPALSPLEVRVEELRAEVVRITNSVDHPLVALARALINDQAWGATRVFAIAALRLYRAAVARLERPYTRQGQP